MSERLRLERVAVEIGGARILDNVSLSVRAGELVALLGPNGAGKTTLLRAALGLVPPTEGAVFLEGRDPRRMAAHLRARRAAYLPQARPLAWPIAVRDAVALGRFAYGASLARLSPQDAAAVDCALAACALTEFQHRGTDTLSGGERARVHVARALAASAPMLLADEPVAALDPLHQWRIMKVIARYVADGGAALAVLHDAALALRFATRIALMRDGRLLADGAPRDVLTGDAFAAAFDIQAEIGSRAGAPYVAITGA